MSADSECAPRRHEDLATERLGPASLATPIVTAELVDDTVYVVTRGLRPPILGAFDLGSREITSHYELPSGSGSWASTSINGGSDLYVGTYGVADLYHFETDTADLSRVARLEDESFVMDMDAHPGDQQVYAGTYPTASVYEYDQSTGSVRDLGSVAPDEAYVRSVAVTADTVFAGVGSHADLVAIDRATGEMESILPPEFEDDSFVYDLEAADGIIVAGTEPSGRLAVIDQADYSSYEIARPDGQDTIDAATVTNGSVYFTARHSGAVYRYDRSSKEITRLAVPSPGDETRDLFERDGTLVGAAGSGAVWTYGLDDDAVTIVDLQSAGLPAHVEPPQSLAMLDGNPVVGGHWRFTVHDVDEGSTTQFRTYGEPKAMTAVDEELYQAIYPGAIIAKYDPTTDEVTQTASVGKEQNRPRDVHYDARSGSLFVGTRPQYGKIGGALVKYDPDSDAVTDVYRNVVQDQSITAVTSIHDTAVVGTEIYGGIGAEPVADEAKLAGVNSRTMEKQWEMTPVPGAETIRHLVTSPDSSAGRATVYGITNDGVFFAIDPRTRSTLARENVVGRGGELVMRDRSILGVSDQALFEFDTASDESAVLKRGFDAGWYNEPQLATDGCAVYLLSSRDLARVTVQR
ncbi:hypothetical protein [Halomicrobium urmianum]|uniref:hypothetical protein n=1 Tax=Halomicrobium urmianum TaxID=1586233 RepID=UPI001CDA1D6E|nr:hypothetical protein [Halomicrobium urmianum]